jgi:mRNA interferase MazF
VLNSLTVAPVTSTIRSIPTELILTTEDGLPEICAANFDNLQTVPKANVSAPIAHLSAAQMKVAASAIAFALGFPES